MATRPDGMPVRLTQIDDLTLQHHPYLEPGDQCFYWGEYRVRTGYGGGPTNQLITNIKKSPLLRDTRQYYYKERDIGKAGQVLGASVRASAQPLTIVPVPPSHIPGHPEYDDRMLNIARIMVQGTASVARELVRQTEGYDPSHAAEGGHRLTPEELMAIYEIPAGEAEPHNTIVVLDDVLTKGAHFRAMKRKILERFPGKTVVGLFIARSVDDVLADFDAL